MSVGRRDAAAVHAVPGLHADARVPGVTPDTDRERNGTLKADGISGRESPDIGRERNGMLNTGVVIVWILLLTYWSLDGWEKGTVYL